MDEFISLGVGVQSSTIAFMADCGDITPMPKAAVFGDTMNEPRKVYEWYQYLKSNIKNFPIYQASQGDLMKDSLRVRRSQNCGNCKHRHPNRKVCGKDGCECQSYIPGRLYLANSIPAYIKNPDGSRGVVDRKCTRDYKIAVVQREIKKLLGIKRIKSDCSVLARVWVGISLDEVDRVKPSQVPWIENRWPLLEKNMSRSNCIDWMLANGRPRPPRSACKNCPYHSDATWIEMRDNDPEEFNEAVAWEKELQDAYSRQEVLKGMPFLHDSLVPLDQVIFDPNKGKHKFVNECEGMCGV